MHYLKDISGKAFFNAIKLSVAFFLFSNLWACSDKQTNVYQGYVDGEFTYIASPYSGNIVKLNVNQGDIVKKGAVLFALDPEPQHSQLNQAIFDLKSAQSKLEDLKKGERQTVLLGIKAQIAKAESELALNKIQYQRMEMLYKKHAVSKESYDIAKTAYLSKLQEIEQLNANLQEAMQGRRSDVIREQEKVVSSASERVKQLEWVLKQKTISAPSDAYIYDRLFKQGEFVPESKPVLSILSAENLYITFFVPATKMAEVKVGNFVTIHCEGCKKSYSTKIFYISPKVEFTPPVIFSRERNYKYVYRIKASPAASDAFDFHLGQPVEVDLS